MTTTSPIPPHPISIPLTKLSHPQTLHKPLQSLKTISNPKPEDTIQHPNIMFLSSNPSPCSHPLQTPNPRRLLNPLLCPPNFLSSPKPFAAGNHPAKSAWFVVRDSSSAAAAAAAPAQPGGGEEEKYEEYEAVIEKPYGLRFRKGRDGSTYIDAIAPGTSADETNVFEVGDKVVATSAVFGEEVWPAAEYGRTMYTIRQRIGPLRMKMQKRYGKPIDSTELTEKEIIRAERNAGFISNRVREIQIENYTRKMEQKKLREKDLREGLSLYKAGQYEVARERFESILGSNPEPAEASVASYNVACCYSKLNQVQAALSALEEAMKSGYEDFKRIRSDPDLANARASEEFQTVLRKYDESFINEGAIDAIKSIFGIFGKK